MSNTQLWLINSASGSSAGKRLLDVAQRWQGIRAEPLDFLRLPEQLRSAASASRLVVAGGDGTFSTVLASPDLGDVPVVCMPLGTANDLSRELGLLTFVNRSDVRDLPALFSSLPTKQFTIWQARSGQRVMPFCNYFALGYEGAVLRDFSAWRSRTHYSSRLLNRMAYSFFGARHMLNRLRGVELSLEGNAAQPCPSNLGILVSNVRSHLGLGLSNLESSPFDTTIECVVTRTVLSYPRMITASLGLTRPPHTFAAGRSLRFSRLPKGTLVQLDGEAIDPLQEGELEIAPLRSVTVVAAS